MLLSNIIIITLLVLLIIFLLTKWFFTTNIIYDIILDAGKAAESTSASENSLFGKYITNKNVIANKDFNENNTSNFMLSLWFFIDNWGNNIANEKNILYSSTKAEAITNPTLQQEVTGISSKVDDNSDPTRPFKNLNVCLDAYQNNLFIDIETYLSGPQDNDIDSTYTRYVIKNIPVQKWNNLTLSIDTKTLDVYLDGKLRNSFILHGIYKIKEDNQETKNLYLGNMNTPSGKNTGFEGFITRIRYEPGGINPQEAYNIYKEGINASLAESIYNKYGLKVTFLEYNKERGSFTI